MPPLSSSTAACTSSTMSAHVCSNDLVTRTRNKIPCMRRPRTCRRAKSAASRRRRSSSTAPTAMSSVASLLTSAMVRSSLPRSALGFSASTPTPEGGGSAAATLPRAVGLRDLSCTRPGGRGLTVGCRCCPAVLPAAPVAAVVSGRVAARTALSAASHRRSKGGVHGEASFLTIRLVCENG